MHSSEVLRARPGQWKLCGVWGQGPFCRSCSLPWQRLGMQRKSNLRGSLLFSKPWKGRVLTTVPVPRSYYTFLMWDLLHCHETVDMLTLALCSFQFWKHTSEICSMCLSKQWAVTTVTRCQYLRHTVLQISLWPPEICISIAVFQLGKLIRNSNQYPGCMCTTGRGRLQKSLPFSISRARKPVQTRFWQILVS